MSEITLEKIEKLFEHHLEPINTKLSAIEETVSKHTEKLDGIAKGVKTLMDDKTVSNKRLDNLEEWGGKVGNKMNIKLEL